MAGISFVLLMIISLSCMSYMGVDTLLFLISPPVDLLNNTVNNIITLYAVDTLCNIDDWGLFCCHQTDFTHKYICIYTKISHFRYLLKNVHNCCFISYI